MITHEEAMRSADTLRKYCDERFRKEKDGGCRECIFHVGIQRKRCALDKYFDYVPNLSEPAVKQRYEELTNAKQG